MNSSKHRQPPKNWSAFHGSLRYRWLYPILFLDWLADWAAYLLSRTSLLEFLNYCGSFSILIGVIFYFMDAPERTKLKHYQAWQVINTAQGKGGSGGRAEALHELNEDHVPLVGVDLSDAFLQHMDLQKADLRRGSFHAADLMNANFNNCNLEQAQMQSANLRNAQLNRVNLTDADLFNADLNGADLTNADLQNLNLAGADLSNANLKDIVHWKSITSLTGTTIHNLRNPPEGFIPWSISKGAIDADPNNPPSTQP
jgi:hypothetical protein